jgi:hypothetical protein
MKIKDLVAELDRVFSLYIRSKYDRCYTCGSTYELQCGHYIKRRFYAVRWDENNCRVQCKNCNEYNRGEETKFGEKLRKEIGEERFHKLFEEKYKVYKRTPDWYAEQIKKYSNDYT